MGGRGPFDEIPHDEPSGQDSLRLVVFAIEEERYARRDAAMIRAAAIAGGMKTMFQDGLAKVLLGETTLEEVARVAL